MNTKIKAMCEYMNGVLITTDFVPEERKYLVCELGNYTDYNTVEKERITVEDLEGYFGHLHYTSVEEDIYGLKFTFEELKTFLGTENENREQEEDINWENY